MIDCLRLFVVYKLVLVMLCCWYHTYYMCILALIVSSPAISQLLTLGMHAQEGYGTCPVCLSVCLSVTMHLTVDRVISTVYLRYVRHSFRLSFIFNAQIFGKNFCWKVMARKSQYANKQLLLATGFSPFGVPCIHQ